ncbi:MAG: hypothetical protein GY942_11780, partial [Aestuariibacter sp.]|nr:hypothetical protein [Aestuariibacter sp.]
MNIGITAVGYVLAGFLFFMGMGLREDLGRLEEQCNTEKIEAIAEAERLARQAAYAAYKRQLDNEAIMRRQANKARDLAEMRAS